MKDLEKSRKLRIRTYGLAGLALTSAIAIADYNSEQGIFAHCEHFAKHLIEIPGNFVTNMRYLPERINFTWAESN